MPQLLYQKRIFVCGLGVVNEHFGHDGVLEEMFAGLALDEPTASLSFELQRVSAGHGYAANRSDIRCRRSDDSASQTIPRMGEQAIRRGGILQ
jgi:hypothetical protein